MKTLRYMSWAIIILGLLFLNERINTLLSDILSSRNANLIFYFIITSEIVSAYIFGKRSIESDSAEQVNSSKENKRDLLYSFILLTQEIKRSTDKKKIDDKTAELELLCRKMDKIPPHLLEVLLKDFPPNSSLNNLALDQISEKQNEKIN